MFEAGDTAIEFSLLDARLLRLALWLGFLPTVAAELKTCERRNWEEFCVPIDDKRLESLRGTVSEQESAACASVVVFFLWVVVTGLVVLLWRLRSLFSSVGAARQRMREAYEMGHCRVDGWTHRWLHVMKGDVAMSAV